jgi:hypothetical protein
MNCKEFFKIWILKIINYLWSISIGFRSILGHLCANIKY